VLLAVPNVSEGRDAETIWAVADAFAATGARLLDVHSDEDHHRSVYTLAGRPGELAPALAEGAAEAVARIDLTEPRGQHPHVGAIDVAPIVFLDDARRGGACAEALLAADLLGEQGLPVYLYGALAGGRTRAELRRGGIAGLRELAPDFGPRRIDDRTGAVLVAARPPLVAFNLELAEDATIATARRVAALVREGGEEGLPGVRALGIAVDGGRVAQVSTNVEDHRAVPLAELLRTVRRHARVRAAELVGLAPAAAFDGWPDDVPVRNRRTLEDAGVR
jgi:glutamate formiminotransferase/glutamate formiminotransferase/formiminotetrahydrofolate cyclodeaminase